jgi:hypothetical protein
MHLSGILQDEFRDARQRAVTVIHAVDEPVAMNHLVQHHVMVGRFIKPGQPNDFLQMNGIVVQIAGGEEFSPRRQTNNAAIAHRRVPLGRGRLIEQVDHGIGLAKVGLRFGHPVRIPPAGD